MKASLFMLLASLPAASAYNSLADAKAHYSHTGCPHTSNIPTEIFYECVHNSGNLQLCLETLEGVITSDGIQIGETVFLLDPKAIEGAQFDGYAFQLHPSDSHPNLSPVSITNYGGGEVCILSGTSPEGLAAKICSNDGFHNNVTVHKTDMEFARAHKGLTLDEVFYHGAIKLPHTSKCGFFTELPVSENIPGEGTFCAISAFDPDYPQQTCMDPKSHQVTVRGLTPEQYETLNPNSTERYTIIRDVQEQNVNTLPDMEEVSEAVSENMPKEVSKVTDLPQTSEEPCQPTITIFDAFTAWWNQKAVEPHC